MRKIKNIPAWAWRKALYFIAAAIVAILGAFGILSEVQVDEWTGQIDKILPYVLGVLIPLLAGSRTHEGSDSKATDEDRIIAQSTALHDVAGTVNQVADRAETAVRDALAQIPGADQTAQAVLAAIRGEERGAHEPPTPDTTTAPVAQTVAPGDGADYVYGR